MKLPEQNNIEKALQSSSGMKRAEASVFLYGKIMEQLRERIPAPVYYTGRLILRFAAAMLILAAFNAATISIIKKPTGTNDSSIMLELANEYFGSDNVNNYNY